GAILRAGGRVFLGWGAPEDALLSPEPEEKPDEEAGKRPQRLLVIPAAVLAALALAVGAVPTITTHAQQAAERFENRAGYAAHVLDGQSAQFVQLPRYKVSRESVLWGVVSLSGAFGVAAFGLWRQRLPAWPRRTAWRVLEPPINALRALHSGHVGDYVAWLTFGTAVLGGCFALGLT